MTSVHDDRPRVLIVDDEKFIRDILADFLGMEGYIVRTAEDGTAALTELSHARYDIDHQRPQDAAHGRHRAARGHRRRGAERAHRHHDRLRHGRDGNRRDEARRLRLHPQAVQGRGGHPRRPARPREAAPLGGEPAAPRGAVALQGERGHHRQPLARRGAGDRRRRGAPRDRRRPRLHVARRRRGGFLRAPAPRAAAAGQPRRRTWPTAPPRARRLRASSPRRGVPRALRGDSTLLEHGSQGRPLLRDEARRAARRRSSPSRCA